MDGLLEKAVLPENDPVGLNSSVVLKRVRLPKRGGCLRQKLNILRWTLGPLVGEPYLVWTPIQGVRKACLRRKNHNRFGGHLVKIRSRQWQYNRSK